MLTSTNPNSLNTKAEDAALDALFLVNQDLNVSYYNRSARILLAKSFPFRMTEAGVLSLLNPADQAHLRAAVSSAGQSANATSSRLMLEDEDGRNLVTIVAPIRDQVGPQLAMIAVRDPEAHLQRQVQAATEQFDFTPAERRLAEALTRGRSPAEYATERGVSLATVRSQLRALLAKSDTTRQVELVATILSIPPL